MKVSILAFASPIVAMAIKDRAADVGKLLSPVDKYENGTIAGGIKRPGDDDIQVICGAPPGSPDNSFPAYDYSYPIGMLLSGGDKRIHVDAGPGKCRQAACNDGGGAGVIVCNDGPATDLRAADIGWFAQRVYEKCKTRRDGQDYVEKGQAFCPDHWNVILSDVGGQCTASHLD
ncbi:hypothetical protein F4819DRAFT_491513 [Hypoxylon fuscum]|nr:hypothetical protein F4819DRAFT_491513 [Hypoxylon fuscum]